MVQLNAERSLSPRPDLAELLARAGAVGEIVRERAQETETNRRVSDDVVARLVEAGLFRILQPRSRGGHELGMDGLVELTAVLGRGCGSTAWAYSICNIHNWFVSCMTKEAQDEFWADPNAIAAGSYPPVGKVEPVSGGYRISGSWGFTSGCDFSQWYFLGILVPPADGSGAPRQVVALVPRSEVRIDDTWHTMGLAGTGSKNIVADNVFVPHHRTLAFADMAAGKAPGTLINTSPTYRQSFLAVLPAGLIAPILGMAEGALADYIDMVKGRATRGAVAGGNRRMAEFANIQSRVADAAASIDAARLMLFRDLAECAANSTRGAQTPLDMRLRNRRDHAFVARLLLQAVDTLFEASGGQSLMLDKPIQRVWRDAHAAASHLSLNWDAVSTMYGQYALGLEPKGQY